MSLTISCDIETRELLEVGGFKPLMVSVHCSHHTGPRLFEHLLKDKRRFRHTVKLKIPFIKIYPDVFKLKTQIMIEIIS